MSGPIPGAMVQRALGCALLAALLLPPSGAGAEHGVLVRRRVVAPDVVVPPSVPGMAPAGRQCPAGVADPVDGDEIRLWVAPGTARRDEPGWSAILRLEPNGKGVAHLLFHADRKFTTLRFPVPPKQIWDTMRRELEEAGEGRFFAVTPQGDLVTKSATAKGMPIEERRVTALNGFGHRKDYELQLLADESLGSVGFALEALVQAIRSGGVDWLALTGPASGVPAGLAITEHHPDTTSRYAEELAAREATAIPEDRFTVPAGYSEVPFTPECF